MSSRYRRNPLPLIKYDFNKATDRRREPRYEPLDELFFRDAPLGDKIGTRLFDKLRNKN